MKYHRTTTLNEVSTNREICELVDQTVLSVNETGQFSELVEVVLTEFTLSFEQG